MYGTSRMWFSKPSPEEHVVVGPIVKLVFNNRILPADGIGLLETLPSNATPLKGMDEPVKPCFAYLKSNDNPDLSVFANFLAAASSLRF